MISVIFSTFNGARVLPRMLGSLARIDAPSDGFKVIAVDNASTDGSANILNSYRDRLPLVVLHEPLKGKNRALNRALPVAEGDLYVFCDDDIVVSRDWLTSWLKVADAHPGYDLFGGATLPLWLEAPPPWILRDVNPGVAFATHSDHQTEGPCEPFAIHGTNMLVRATLFADGVGFSTGIGPNGSAVYAMGSETDFSLRAIRRGHKCWLAREPAVRHIIRPEQMTRAWLMKRAYRYGKGQFLLYRSHPIGARALAAKNTLKSAMFPMLLPLMSESASWRRRWQWIVDQGYEDAAREEAGLAPRWSDNSRA